MSIDPLLHHRLACLRLVGPPLDTPAGAVEWLVAVQAQDYAAAKWSLGLRLGQASDELVEHAFNNGALLRTHLLRPTWHFVAPADIRWLLALTAPRVHALNGTFYRRFGIDDETVRRLHRALAQALQGGNTLTRDELRPLLEAAGLRVAGEQRMSYLLMRAELDGLICLTAIVVVDGRIVGTWKRVLRAREVVVRLRCFAKLSAAQGEALAAAVERFGAFLGLPVRTEEP